MTLDALDVARAAFLAVEDSERYVTLDRFWELKGEIYNRYITGWNGVLADQFSQVYFAEEATGPDERAWFDDEIDWGKRFPELFAALSALRSRTPEAMRNRTLHTVRREYIINKEHACEARYIVKKTTCRLKSASTETVH